MVFQRKRITYDLGGLSSTSPINMILTTAPLKGKQHQSARRTTWPTTRAAGTDLYTSHTLSGNQGNGQYGLRFPARPITSLRKQGTLPSTCIIHIWRRKLCLCERYLSLVIVSSACPETSPFYPSQHQNTHVSDT